MRLVQNNKLVFESAPGTVTQSAEWGMFHKHLTAFGSDRIVAGDFKAFDKRMPPQVIEAAFRIMIDVCKASGNYSREDILVLHGICEDVMNPMTDFNGDLVSFVGSNPSGWPLTVILNGLANALYLRYCYLQLNPEREVDTFRENVHLLTYGDDNVMGVSRTCPWFNHTSIAQALGDIDIVYTMPDKEAESVPYITIHDATFLKRSWRWSPDLQDYACPLDHDSIEKMLMTWVRSKHVLPEVQMAAVVDSALREYFFYGRATFEAKRALFRAIMSDHNLLRYLPSTLVLYDDLVKQWQDSTKKLGL